MDQAMMKRRYLHGSLPSVVAAIASIAFSIGPSVQLLSGSEPLDFVNDVLPILQKNCVACHNIQKPEGGLNLESYEALSKGGDSGNTFETGKGAESSLVKRVRGEEDIMPPEGNNVGAKNLTEEEILILTQWIDSGAAQGEKVAGSGMHWQKLPDTIRPIYSMDSTTDGQFTIVGRGNLASIYRWAASGPQDVFTLNDPEVAKILASQATDNQATQTAQPATHLDLVQSVAMTRDGMRIATGGYRDVKIWKRSAGLIEDQLSKLLQGSAAVSVSPNSQWIAKTTHASSLDIILRNESRVLVRYELSGASQTIAWNADSSSLAVQTQNNEISIFDSANFADPSKALAPFRIRLSVRLKQMILNADGSMLGVTSENQLVRWQIHRSPEAAAAPPAEIVPESLKLTQDSVSRIASAGDKLVVVDTAGRLYILNASSLELVRTIETGAPVVNAFPSGDAVRIIAVNADGVSRSWAIADGAQIWENKFDLETLNHTAKSEESLARHKAKFDRITAKLPELEANLKAETENLEKVKSNRTETERLVQAKVAEIEASKAHVAEGEALLAAAQKALEEAKAKVEAAEIELANRKQNQANLETAKATEQTKLENIDKNLANANQATEKASVIVKETKQQIESDQKELETFDALAKATKESMKTVPVLQAAISQDSREIIALRADGVLRIIHAGNGLGEADIAPASTGSSSANSLAALGAGDAIATFDDGRSLHATYANRWELERTIGTTTESPFSDRITALAFNPQGDQLVVGSGPPSRFGDLKLLSVETGSVVKDFGEVHSDTIFVARFSPDSRTIATGGADKVVRLHSVSEQTPTRTLEGHTHHVLGLAWHDNGHLLASSSADNTIKVWDVDLGQAQRTISGFGKEVTCIEFVGRSDQLLSSSSDRHVRVHNAADGKAIRTIGGAGDSLYSLTVYFPDPAEPQSAIVVSGGQDGKLMIWKAEDGSVVQQVP